MQQNYIEFPQIDPVIFEVGPVAVRWYALMYLIGFVAAYFLANRRAKASNDWNSDQVSDLLFYGFLGVILGGRIGYVLFYQFDYFLQNPLYLFKIWEGGMSFHGGLLGVIAALYWFARTTKKRFLQVGDFVAPLVPIGLATGRFGNFINSELWGRTTDVPWAVLFPNGGPFPRHPSQLYEMALEGILLFIILWWFSSKPRPAGSVGGLFLLGYGCARFFVEFFREPDAHLGFVWLQLSMGQLLSAPMIILGGWLIYFAYQHRKN